MRNFTALVAIAAVLAAPLQSLALEDAAAHVVTDREIQQRLLEAEAQRQADRAAVGALIRSEETRAVAAEMGVDAGRLEAGVAALTDDELRDLAQRAAALQTDPVAGLDRDIKTLLTVFLLVAIVILVLQAVD